MSRQAPVSPTREGVRCTKGFCLPCASQLIGASLLVSAAFAGSTATSKSEVSKGGTLRLNVSETDYEYLDPALAYDSIGWATLYAVNQMLLNYPDKPASAGGNQLVPEAATGFPTVSKDGKTYIFTVKSGMKFSDGSNVTAAAFARSIMRVCHPDQASPAVAFANNIAGLRRLQREEGQPDRCQGCRSEADGPADQAPTRRSWRRSRCRSSRP